MKTITPLRAGDLTPDLMLLNISQQDCANKKFALVLAVTHEGDVEIYENNIPHGILKSLAMELLEYVLSPAR